jgi:hypothetical protein
VEVIAVDITELSDEYLGKECLPYVKRLYTRFGGNDEAGKNPKMAAAMKKYLIKKYSPPRKKEGRKL